MVKWFDDFALSWGGCLGFQVLGQGTTFLLGSFSTDMVESLRFGKSTNKYLANFYNGHKEHILEKYT